MNWKKIQQAWESGDKQMAVRLLESMIYELGLKEKNLKDFLQAEKSKGGIEMRRRKKKVMSYMALIDEGKFLMEDGYR